jgi:hypothetical protein
VRRRRDVVRKWMERNEGGKVVRRRIERKEERCSEEEEGGREVERRRAEVERRRGEVERRRDRGREEESREVE